MEREVIELCPYSGDKVIAVDDVFLTYKKPDGLNSGCGAAIRISPQKWTVFSKSSHTRPGDVLQWRVSSDAVACTIR